MVPEAVGAAPARAIAVATADDSSVAPAEAAASQILLLLRRVTSASWEFADSFADSHDLHRTDLNALSELIEASREGRSLSAGELATRLRLSAPATTALLDRLDRMGHARRARNRYDRRVVEVQINPAAAALGRQLFEPMGRHVQSVVGRFDEQEVEVIGRFLGDVLAAVRDAQQEVETGPPGPPGPTHAVVSAPGGHADRVS